jgi:hypothetical protein
MGRFSSASTDNKSENLNAQTEQTLASQPKSDKFKLNFPKTERENHERKPANSEIPISEISSSLEDFRVKMRAALKIKSDA